MKDIYWYQVLELWLRPKEGEDIPLDIDYITHYFDFPVNIMGITYINFSSKIKIDYNIHEKIYVKYKNARFIRDIEEQPLYLIKKPLELKIRGFGGFVVKELENIKVNTKEKQEVEEPTDTTIKKIGATASSLTIASAAIFIRYFVVVDILINLFGKINVELGPRIGKMVDLIKTLQFPSIGFVQAPSPINDGGDKAIENHQDYLKSVSKNKEDDQNKITKSSKNQTQDQSANRKLWDERLNGKFFFTLRYRFDYPNFNRWRQNKIFVRRAQ